MPFFKVYANRTPMGVFEAEDARGALDEWAKDAGYENFIESLKASYKYDEEETDLTLHYVYLSEYDTTRISVPSLGDEFEVNEVSGLEGEDG